MRLWASRGRWPRTAATRRRASSSVSFGLDAVAVADVHHSLAVPHDGAVEGGHAPIAHTVHEDVEGRLVELDHIHAERGELPRLLIDQGGQRHAELRAAAVVGVVDGIGDRHGPGDGELQAALGLSAEEADLVGVDRTAPAERRRHRRHIGLVAVGADADRDHLGKVHAVPARRSPIRSDDASLLAVGDDVDAGLLLIAQGQADGVALALLERRAREAPRRPERFRRGEPRGLGRLPAMVVSSIAAAWYHAAHESLGASPRHRGTSADGLLVGNAEKQWYKPTRTTRRPTSNATALRATTRNKYPRRECMRSLVGSPWC